MKGSFRIPRVSLIWLLVALVAVILPHVPHMPVWLSLLCLGCVVWRVLIFLGRLSWPGLAVRIAMVALTVAAVVVAFRRDVFSTEATVSVLIAGLALKLLEMRRKRDVLLIVYLCYFTIVAEFIYSQSIPIALYMALCVVLISAALISLHQNPETQSPRRTVRLAALVLTQSVPIMLALFLLVPRMPPLWAMPLNSESAFTGLGETMSPGDFGELTRSSDVAFRVSFEGETPPYSELYWRGLTLDSFDGRTWRRGDAFGRGDRQRLFNPNRITDWYDEIRYLGDPVDYDVILEPTNQNWVFTLQMPRMQEENLVMREDYQVEHLGPISQRYNYQGRSFLDFRAGLRPSASVLRRALTLPEQGNGASRAFAAALWERNENPRDYIDAVLTHFNREGFFYVTDPGQLGEDPVDEFLFSTRRGFCEHYAGAFTFLMRAAGIPARVVTGYMGGERNDYNGAYTIRQYDAHAWSEVWLEGQGWLRVDPTAAVAPERIELGSEAALQSQENFFRDTGFSLLRFRGNLLLNDLRLRLEMIDYAWNRWVLNYDRDRQFQLLLRLFGAAGKREIVLSLLGVIALSMLVCAFFLLRPSSRTGPHRATALYLRYCHILAALGFARRPGETPARYYARLRDLRPELAPSMREITDLYTELAFSPADAEGGKEKLRRLRRIVRRFGLSARA